MWQEYVLFKGQIDNRSTLLRGQCVVNTLKNSFEVAVSTFKKKWIGPVLWAHSLHGPRQLFQPFIFLYESHSKILN